MLCRYLSYWNEPAVSYIKNIMILISGKRINVDYNFFLLADWYGKQIPSWIFIWLMCNGKMDYNWETTLVLIACKTISNFLGINLQVHCSRIFLSASHSWILKDVKAFTLFRKFINVNDSQDLNLFTCSFNWKYFNSWKILCYQHPYITFNIIEFSIAIERFSLYKNYAFLWGRHALVLHEHEISVQLIWEIKNLIQYVDWCTHAIWSWCIFRMFYKC